MLSSNELKQIQDMLTEYYGALDNILYKNYGSDYEKVLNNCRDMRDRLDKEIFHADIQEIQDGLQARWTESGKNIDEDDLGSIRNEARRLMTERGYIATTQIICGLGRDGKLWIHCGEYSS